MNRLIATSLIWFIFLTHSAWAVDIDSVGKYNLNPSIELSQDSSSTLINNDESCSDHCSHSSAHTAGLIPAFSFESIERKNSLHITIKIITYPHSEAPPYKPPRA